MPTYEFVTVDVFTDQRFGGNPLAVFPDARGLTNAQMQALAIEFNLSETTFVLPAENPANTARVRIFTPATELPFAGHPTVGTGWVLAQRGRDSGGKLRFKEIAGLVRVDIHRDAAGEISNTVIAAPQPLSLGQHLPVAEDPGSAATPLAALLLSLTDAESGAWDIMQGVEMGRPSLLRTTARRMADGIRATVGGNCVPVFQGSVTL